MSLFGKETKIAGNPRSSVKLLQHLPSEIRQQLEIPKPVKLTKVVTKKGKDVPCTLTDWLWSMSTDQADEALNTGFIQGIQSGQLDPTAYGGYTVQDAVYCHNATDYHKIAEENASCDPIMSAFIHARMESYAEYTEMMFKQWYIADPTGIAMGKAAQDYSDFEKNVAKKMHPIYFLIAMIPCTRLWQWLAEQIKTGISKNNVYSFWIEANHGGSHTLEDFVNENAEKYEVDHGKALDVYLGAMRGEVGFFTSATV
uniref:uncharacterized protein n=1 Tax=Myxine glutinosa TaxID=7769 RepID=UPI00358E7C1F